MAALPGISVLSSEGEVLEICRHAQPASRAGPPPPQAGPAGPALPQPPPQYAPWHHWAVVCNDNWDHWDLEQWQHHMLPFPDRTQLIQKEKLIRKQRSFGPAVAGVDVEKSKCRPNKSKRAKLRFLVREMVAEGLTPDQLPAKITDNPTTLTLALNLWKAAAEEAGAEHSEGPKSGQEPEEDEEGGDSTNTGAVMSGKNDTLSVWTY